LARAALKAQTLDLLVNLVWSGFYSPAMVSEMVLEQADPSDHEALMRAVKEEFVQKREEESEWPAVTDCDTLDRAFEELNRAGIVALHNAGFTQAEGLEEVHEEYVKRGGLQGGVQGYCFYHGEDVERAVEGGGLFLAFGSSHGDDPGGLLIGARVRDALRAAGLTVEWNATMDKRLWVQPLVWRRRE